MAEKSDENKSENEDEFGKAPVLEEPSEEISSSLENDMAALADIDQMLAEEDPQFLKQISDIRVVGIEENLSIMDDVLVNLRHAKKNPIKWRFHIQNLFYFKEEPRKIFLFWSLVGLGIISIAFGSRISNLFFSKGLFLKSYAQWNSHVISYNPITETEFFYDNPRFAKNLITMSKMVTNIKSSENSGNNPMLALELSVEGMSAEAIIEIKDREAEFKDILLRQIEEFNYDELTTIEGKKALLDKFTVAINANLSQGQVRRSMLKSFILKP